MKNYSSHGTVSLIKAVREYGLLITDFLIVPTVLTNPYKSDVSDVGRCSSMG